MKIDQKKMVQVDVKTLRIYVKCSDRFSYWLEDAQGEKVFEQDDGYVPDFMPGDHYGDYIILDIDVDTGMVTNWKKNSVQMAEDIQAVINKQDN